MPTNEERLRQLEMYQSKARLELDRRELAEIRQQMLERIISYRGPVHTVTEALWQDLIGKDYLTPEQREAYRLVYDYCVSFSELRALRHKFNLIAQSQGYDAAIKWKAKEYVPIVLAILAFIADASTVLSLLRDQLGRLVAPDPPKYLLPVHMRLDASTRRLLVQLAHPNLLVRERTLQQLSDLIEPCIARGNFHEYMAPIMDDMKSENKDTRENARAAIYKLLEYCESGENLLSLK